MISCDLNITYCCCYQDGYTPLHIASEYGYLEVVKILLAYGADVNDKTDVSNKKTCCYSDYY